MVIYHYKKYLVKIKSLYFFFSKFKKNLFLELLEVLHANDTIDLAQNIIDKFDTDHDGKLNVDGTEKENLKKKIFLFS